MRLARPLLATSFGIYLIAQIFFLIYIQFPTTRNFDEFHYVPSAQQFLELRENQNYEHPPLAKQLIAVGLKVGGDRPFGWRLMSTVFGSLTLVAMYLWAYALFQSRSAALYAAALTLVNQLLYVQARIGMLDTFMFAFIAGGGAAFTAAALGRGSPRFQRGALLFAGACLGLAISCKWFAVVFWGLCLGLGAAGFGFVEWAKRSSQANEAVKTKAKSKKKTPLAQPLLGFRPFPSCRARDLFLGLALLPIIFYYLPFLAFFWVKHEPPYTWWDILVRMQQAMWDGQLRVVSSHPYMSDWTSWAILKRPIWYAFDHVPGGFTRGVMLLGNPLLMWSGLVALLTCASLAFAKRSVSAALIVLFYSVLYFSWALIPRKVAFYYYYYPAGMILSLAVTQVWEWLDPEEWLRWLYWGLCALIFLYFFPILGALKIAGDSFRQYMWLTSWI